MVYYRLDYRPCRFVINGNLNLITIQTPLSVLFAYKDHPSPCNESITVR